MEGTMPVIGMVAGHAQRARAESFRDHNRTFFDKQRRSRRGPTPEILMSKHIDNSRLIKADDPDRRREMRSFTIAMSVLFMMVMTFVWQHFSSIEMGYSIEAKKLQVEHMREENHQLRLSEAQLSDPGRIDHIARQLGLDTPQPGQVVRPDGSFAGGAPVLAEAHLPASVLP